MGQKWNNALADVTAGFPGAVWAGMSTRLEDLNGYTVTGEVIGASLWTLTGGRYRAFLDLVPLEQATFVCVDASEDDEPLTKIPWGETPAADEVAVSLEHGGVEVHASRSTHNIRFNYRGRGSDVGPGLLNRTVAELRAVQTHGLATAEAVDDLVVEVGELGDAVDAVEAELAGAVSRFAHVLYLSEGGDDEDGTGSQADPYRTVNKAIEVINASSETDWAVVMGPGLYTYTTANALPVLGGTKRVAWVGSGAELTTLHISQPQDGDAEEAFPWDSPTLSYAAIDGVSITSEIYVVLEDEFGYSWILDFATLQSAASEDACISSSALVVESGSPNMRIHTDGDVVGSYLSKTDLFAADGMGLARSMRGCRVFLGVVNAIDVVNCQAAGAGGSINGTRVFGCSSGRNINGTESVISCTLNSEVVDSRITSPLVDGCTVNGGRLFQSLDASNTWRVRNTKLVRSTGGNRDIVDFLGGTGLKTTVMEDVHFVYTGTFEEEPSGDVTVLAIHDGRHDVTLINCTIDSTCIPIMRSHPNVLIDGNRLSAKNIRMIGGSLTLRRAADDGPEDRNSCVVDSGLGEMVFEGVTFRNLTEASTREDVAYACVSCRSDTGGADGTSTILFNNCTFESTLPAADIAGAKCSVLFLSDIGAETVYVTFEGVTTIREDGNQDHTFGGLGGARVTVRGVVSVNTAGGVTFENAPVDTGSVHFFGTPAVSNVAEWWTALGAAVGITGGAINGTPIGATTPSTAAFRGSTYPVQTVTRDYTFASGSAASVRFVANRTSGTNVDGNGAAFVLSASGGSIGATPIDYAVFSGVRAGADNTSEAMIATNVTGTITTAATFTPSLADFRGNTIRVRTARTPASATAAGNAGDICWDANYIYVCTATNTWKRVAIATW